LDLLRNGAPWLGPGASAAFFSTAGVFFVVLTVFLQVGLGLSAFRTGLMFLPFAIGFSASSIVFGLIANRIGALIINLGTFLMVFGLLSITATWVNALTASLTCNFVLIVVTFFLALLLPRRVTAPR
jgi:hypothetical protein